MGCYNTILVPCPCGNKVEHQSKAGRHTLDYWPSTGTYRWHNRNGRAARRGRSDQIGPDRMLELLTEAMKR